MRGMPARHHGLVLLALVALVPAVAAAQATPEESIANCQKVINTQLQALSAAIEKIHTAGLGPAINEHFLDAAKPFSKTALSAIVQLQKLQRSSPSYVGLALETNVTKACDPSVNGTLTHTRQDFLDEIADNLRPVCEKLSVHDLDTNPFADFLTCIERYADRSAKHRLKVKYPRAPEVVAELRDTLEKDPPSGFSQANLDRAKRDLEDTLTDIDHNLNSVPDPDEAIEEDRFAAFVRLVFVTGPLFVGNFGGLATADAFCQRRASDYSLPGTYVAWLSDGTTSAASRVSHRPGFFALVDGTKVADNWKDLVDGTLDAPIDRGAGGAVHDGPVWTGTAADGSNAKPALCPNGCNCQQWNGGGTGLQGRSDAVGAGWSRAGAGSCDTRAGLYCIQQ